MEEIAGKLREKGMAAVAYHAGLPAARRGEVQEGFLRDELQVVVATVAFVLSTALLPDGAWLSFALAGGLVLSVAAAAGLELEAAKPRKGYA